MLKHLPFVKLTSILKSMSFDWLVMSYSPVIFTSQNTGIKCFLTGWFFIVLANDKAKISILES